MKKIIFLVVTLTIIFACKNSKKQEINTQEARHTIKRLQETKALKLAMNNGIDSLAIDSLNKIKTSIQFEQQSFDFGKIKEGEILKKDIIYTNTGKNPLIIFSAFGSCGCTVPTYSKKPLMAGASDTLHIEFNSENRKGNNTKTVTIFANTEPTFNKIDFTVQVN